MKFSTAGNIGDSIYQTLFMLELSERIGEPIETVHIQVGKKATYSQEHVYGEVQMTWDAAEFLAPLLNAQGWKPSISTGVPQGFVDLDQFRTLKLNFASNDIRLWVYQMLDIPLPMDLQRKTISARPNASFNDNIVVAKTSRYLNVFTDFSALKPYAKDVVFIGLEQEWKDFQEKHFKCEFYKCRDAIDAAGAIAGCKLMVANQCGLYAIAEQMKTPRVLVSAETMKIKIPDGREAIVPGPTNVVPQGGICAIAGTQGKFEAVLKRILNG